MALLTNEEWTVLTDDEKVSRATEAPLEIQVEAAKADVKKNADAEHGRKSDASQKEIDRLNTVIAENATKNKPVKTSEEYADQYVKNLADDPFTANSKLGRDVAQYVLGESKKADRIRRKTIRTLRKEVKDFDKYEDSLDEMLDDVQDPRNISEKSIRVMLDSLRGRSSTDDIKEAEERGAKKALEDAGIVSVADGTGKGDTKPKSDLTPEQEAEKDRMLIEDVADYKELLRGLQEKDKALGKPPRKLIGAKT